MPIHHHLPPSERPPSPAQAAAAAAREAELRSMFRDTVSVLGDTCTLCYMLVADREKAEFVCGFLETAGLLKTIEEMDLTQMRSVECYGLPLVYRVLRPEAIDFHRMGQEMRDLGLDPEVVNVKAELGFEPTTDAPRFNKQIKKVLNRMTSRLSAAVDRRAGHSTEWTEFRRAYKKGIARANKFLQEARAELQSGALSLEQAREQTQGFDGLLVESRAAFDRLLATGQVPTDALDGWKARFERFEQRLRKLQRKLEGGSSSNATEAGP